MYKANKMNKKDSGFGKKIAQIQILGIIPFIELIQIISHPEYIDKGKFGKTLAGEWVTYYFKKKVNKNEKI